MKKTVVTLLLIFACLVCFGAVSLDRLHFKKAGFSIQPLDVKPGRESYQVLVMFLPSADGFAPNVNVQIQPFSGTINEYAEISHKQFNEAGFTIIKEAKLGDNAYMFEYSGEFQNKKLYWYAKAMTNGKAVYLITATAAETQWNTVASKLKECVDSFAMGKDEKEAEPEK